jgi:probable rRNA maturation factor
MIEIVNRQRRRPIPTQRLGDIAARALKAIGTTDVAVTVAFISDRSIRHLNQRFRGKNVATDVLSFPAEQADFELSEGRTLGDIVISTDRAAEQAAQHGLEFEEELAQLILHGLLHLHGYDHESDNGEMDALEVQLREKLGL